MDIVIFSILVIFSFVMGMTSIVLPNRPLVYKVLGIFFGAFGSVLAALTAVQLLQDTVIVISNTNNPIYPLAYVPFFTMVFCAVCSIAKIS